MKKTHLTETRFSNLELSDSIIKGLKEAGFINCTPIQDKSLPLSLRGKDIAGQAQTGTGKTATFLLATFQHLINDESEKIKNPRALILAPTRELAIQIHKDALVLGKYLNLKLALIYGGTDYQKQLDKIKTNVDIIIGTPGRIIDFYKQGAFTLDNIQVTVLDEADRMFDLGFIKDIRFLLRRMPPADKRLNLLFSATLSYKVTELAYEHMNNPVLIRIEPEEVTSKAIKQIAYCPANDQKIPLLLGLLKHHQPQRSIVFVNTKRCAERLDDYLQANGYKVAMLSGDVPQEKRQKLLAAFQDNQVNLLIATDVAARGLHIPDVSHVFNYDLPQDVEDYVHRIGRTARFGASGEAISFICEEYAYSMPDIEDYIGEKVPVAAIEPELLAEHVAKPERREPRERVVPHGKRPPRPERKPREHRPHPAASQASTPENPQSPETPQSA
ncbi:MULTISPECIES: ATP-dependent RNA helicase RhlB [Methylomonas]|uniref:ATP-dependent RNA helicase RhlB n=1 Tax=Methylomonas koyamae TaxID=702114 RepID=A0AA91I4G2_9GAMM|nr:MULTISPECIES: ATP-dependent RNA helicase RhlB [Methylomonas]ANE54075.1 RNA helicase [Methylomonas sp. DH-1]OAI22092.1 RNA helicase [Methylomonas koyamae]WNB76373.1 ATP-dependent RNA helicase RhlB [Methylomonas koyamae]